MACLKRRLRRNCVPGDEVAIICVINACARLGMQGDAGMLKTGLGRNVNGCNAVMDMYVKCALLGEARRVFEEMKEHSVVSWTVILEGPVKWEGVESGRMVFDRMPEKRGCLDH
ncbi:hypothetical protein L6164_006777 [Bauhinia variegata]|uniref:Uncharacterized protein n=1 Tax=Bauhinia variegata TaxID=167791 RepID=A0ACB9PVB6_BAUVA|nr:hypothetical protein L6164_006777 [Bauhinia variegata]